MIDIYKAFSAECMLQPVSVVVVSGCHCWTLLVFVAVRVPSLMSQERVPTDGPLVVVLILFPVRLGDGKPASADSEKRCRGAMVSSKVIKLLGSPVNL